MKRYDRYFTALITGIFVTVIMAVAVLACTVPVFRYALERWEADPYELVVFSDGPLSGGEREVVTWLENTVRERETLANLTVTSLDVSGELDEQYQRLWARESTDTLPHAVLLYPRSLPGAPPAWSGTLSEDIARALIDSPVRRELTRRIMEGQSTVFLFVESGDAALDDKAYQTLDSTVGEMKTTLRIPDQAPVESPQFVPISEDGPELKIDFSVIRISRDDPAETMLIRMLDGTEPDLADYREYPMAFPVYGRGRALYALVGDGISARNVEESCVFLTGACSCQVKALNPGVDLLITADWESSLSGQWVRDVELPPLVGFSELVADAAATAKAQDSESTSAAEPMEVPNAPDTDEISGADKVTVDDEPAPASEPVSVVEPARAEAATPVAQVDNSQTEVDTPRQGSINRNVFAVVALVLVVTGVLSIVVLRRKPGGGR